MNSYEGKGNKIPREWRLWAEENIKNGSDLLIEKHTKLLGQRTYTVWIYLNNVEKGGETFFPGLNKSFKPIMGKALIWNNLNYDGMPNRNTIHQGKPVITGHKSIITKWFREKKKLNH